MGSHERCQWKESQFATAKLSPNEWLASTCIIPESCAFVFEEPVIPPWILIRRRSKRSWILISFLLSDSTPTIFTDSLSLPERQTGYFFLLSLAFFRCAFFPAIVNHVRRKKKNLSQKDGDSGDGDVFSKVCKYWQLPEFWDIFWLIDNFAITSFLT